MILRVGRLILIAWFLTLISTVMASAITLAELQSDKTMTPERFARLFSSFTFQLGGEVQPPEIFLAKRSGDCDDFATLAAEVLSAHGYTTRLLVVHMRREVHVVCFVAEVNAYLDFNLRQNDSPLVTSDGSLKDVATKVAASFKDTWYAASEFTYHHNVRRIIVTDFP